MSLEIKHAILDVLLSSLDEEHALGVMEHRKVKKVPLTVLAAKILAKQFALCADPNAAAEEMINRGWTGFKADWLRRQSAPARKRSYADVAFDRWSNGPEDVFGGDRDVECISTDRRQPGSDDGHVRDGFAGPLVPSHH